MEHPYAGSPQQDFSSASTLVVDTPSQTSRRRRYESLRAQAPVVVPSLLLCDFGHLADEVRKLEDAGAPALHLDVMDGHFVPNLTYGPPIVKAVRRVTELPIETHLMISDPAHYAEQFFEAGADAITFHYEAVPDPRPLLEKLRSLGAVAGLAYNPETPVSAIRACLDACDSVLTMSVSPGFGNQHFETVALTKLRELSGLVGKNVLLEVDGGVNAKTIADCAAAGAHSHIVGSAIFSHPDYSQTIAALLRLARSQPRTH
ncbi:MAG: ribulose-phosphate 3-epimerase [Pirellulales bacterium]